jgi:hypothetical protein
MRAGTESQALAFTTGAQPQLHGDVPSRWVEREITARPARRDIG